MKEKVKEALDKSSGRDSPGASSKASGSGGGDSKTEAERRFEEIQRQRVRQSSSIPFIY